jgi:hypothetical protein
MRRQAVPSTGAACHILDRHVSGFLYGVTPRDASTYALGHDEKVTPRIERALRGAADKPVVCAEARQMIAQAVGRVAKRRAREEAAAFAPQALRRAAP